MFLTPFSSISTLLGRALCSGFIIAAAQASSINVTGIWRVAWIAKDQVALLAVAEIRESGTTLIGSLTVNGNVLPLRGSAQARQIAFVAENNFRRIAFTGVVDGNDMTGKTDENLHWSASRN